MIKLKDFNDAIDFIYKKAKECDVEIIQVEGGFSSFTFYGKTHGCITPIYAEINTENAAIMLGQPLVEETSFFSICADGTVVQISEREYDKYGDEDEW